LVTWSVLVVRMRRQAPYLVAGWWWYLITLVPVIGLVQVGSQAMADRYTYLPLVGLSVAVAWGVPDLLRRARMADSVRRPVLFAIAGLVLIALLQTTRVQLSYWRDDETLSRHTIAVTPPNAKAHSWLGAALGREQRMGEAILEFDTALAIDPTEVEAYINLGNLYGTRAAQTGNAEDFDRSVANSLQALKIMPNSGYAHNNLAVAYFVKRRYAEAWKELHLAEQNDFEPNAGFRQALARMLPDPGE
jgi:protein O-mannosyl-transferase